ncbi:hypothetical protein SAMN05216368_10255 [Cryobacterium flavum]|uniref:Peptidase propeptide and YPEB domain-containing protein n=1 Tax=Cryobacterium flavum TaxID=1424659 RepID=A0A4R8VDS6_9MICO|nr:hypothetical protein [Cryobacterium flavum]TFB81209.1 hypothetical protein E3O21_05015 [Cryobacterium flavum]SDM70518.1 hypothetical protein SAMN05216368_10255 [Cryobacterium flavum]
MNKKNILIASAIGVVLVLGGAGIALAVSDIGDNDGPLSGETLDRASNAALAEVGPGTVTSAERNDDGGSAYDLEVHLENGTTVDVELNDAFDVVWVGDFDNDNSNNSSNNSSSTPSAATDTSAADQAAGERASAEAAALAAIGSGRVTDFDRDDDWDHVYEVEVTLDNGSDRDVELDANFVVVRIDDVQQ